MRLRSLVSLSLAVLLLAQAAAPARSEPEVEGPGLPAELAEAVKSIVTRVARAKEGLRYGMKLLEVAPLTKGSADIVGDHTLLLANTAYAPTQASVGIVEVWVDPEEGFVAELTVTLLTGPYDPKRMRKHLIEVGRQLGFALVDAPNTERTLYADEDDELDRDLWIAMGDGTLVVEASRP
jgi:hypothetical protein